MDDLFLKLFNMSVTAGWVVLALVAVRLVFRKAPKRLLCALWGLVGLRLILPFTLKSVVSLIPSTETVGSDPVGNPVINSGFSAFNTVVNPVISQNAVPLQTGRTQWESFLAAAPYLWLCGAALMLAWAVFSYLRVRGQTRVSVPVGRNVYLCDGLPSPFLLGIFRPRIYLPSDVTDEEQTFILAHEQAHLKRFDHIWKPLGFLLLSVYWFHPLLWVAYLLLCRDIESACDERVIKHYSDRERAMYSQTILRFSAPRRAVSACPVAFGETGVKERVKSVLSYKKPTVWILAAAVALSVVLTVVFVTDPKKSGAPKNAEEAAGEYIVTVSDPTPLGHGASFTLSEDGTFRFSRGAAYSYMPSGEWTLDKDGTLTLRIENVGMYVFSWKGKGYAYDSKKSDIDSYLGGVLDIADGTVFVPASTFDGHVFFDGGSDEAQIKLEECTLKGNKRQIAFRFINNSDKTLFYGLDHRLFILTNDGTDAEEIELPPHHLQHYAIAPGKTGKKVVFSVPDGLDLTKTFRLETYYRIAEDENDEAYQKIYTATVFFGGLDGTVDCADKYAPIEYRQYGWYPTLVILDDGSFCLDFGSNSDYIANGNVKSSDKNEIILKNTSDGGKYSFKKTTEGNLIFNAKKSTGHYEGDIKDGTIFFRNSYFDREEDIVTADSGDENVCIILESCIVHEEGGQVAFRLRNESDFSLQTIGGYHLFLCENGEQTKELPLPMQSPAEIDLSPHSESKTITLTLPEGLNLSRDYIDYIKENLTINNYEIEFNYKQVKSNADSEQNPLKAIKINFADISRADRVGVLQQQKTITYRTITQFCDFDFNKDGKNETIEFHYPVGNTTSIDNIAVYNENHDIIATAGIPEDLLPCVAFSGTLRIGADSDNTENLRFWIYDPDTGKKEYYILSLSNGLLRLVSEASGKDLLAAENDAEDKNTRTYIMPDTCDDPTRRVRFTLNDETKTFILNFGTAANRTVTGSYERSPEGILTLTEKKTGNTFVFDGNLCFNKEKSTADAYGFIEDRDIFNLLWGECDEDLDGDGKTEHFLMIDAGLSGYQGYTFIAENKSELLYLDFIVCENKELIFDGVYDGTIRLKIISREKGLSGESSFYSTAFVDVKAADGQLMFYYSGTEEGFIFND
ncbi:MAG: hypothetical protein IJK23_12900 [Clostridia bacterium]|nr:hypothetical protein [Clostridia bacterium]